MKTEPAQVVVAMSGGMDSSLAAALLKMAGWEVHGLHFNLPASSLRMQTRIDRVQAIAEQLKIPLRIMDLREAFKCEIIDPFVDAYLHGITPNPCVRCNELIKFEYLLRHAREQGIPYLATGHYARLMSGEGGSPVELWRGLDKQKEQSYFLHRLGKDSLSMALFPLGGMTKEHAKRQAAEMDLPVHSISESQEICFIAGDDYRLFVETHRGRKVTKVGSIITVDNEKLGEHGGAYRYTIGQRQGLGISSATPYYVKEIRPETNEVVVARREELYSRRVVAESFNWIGEMPSRQSMKAQAQIRYRHRAAPGHLESISSERVRFIFDEPQWAITPGQALVCYERDRVLGGGWIRKG